MTLITFFNIKGISNEIGTKDRLDMIDRSWPPEGVVGHDFYLILKLSLYG
jgi:hypothetical protein